MKSKKSLLKIALIVIYVSLIIAILFIPNLDALSAKLRNVEFTVKPAYSFILGGHIDGKMLSINHIRAQPMLLIGFILFILNIFILLTSFIVYGKSKFASRILKVVSSALLLSSAFLFVFSKKTVCKALFSLIYSSYTNAQYKQFYDSLHFKEGFMILIIALFLLFIVQTLIFVVFKQEEKYLDFFYNIYFKIDKKALFDKKMRKRLIILSIAFMLLFISLLLPLYQNVDNTKTFMVVSAIITTIIYIFLIAYIIVYHALKGIKK